MPKHKDLKRHVRARMQKTGESYTTARKHVVEKKARATAAPRRDLAAIAGMSDDAVAAKTGKTWQQWLEVLDAAGAASLPHRDIAEHVYGLGVPGWWAQMVTVGYERLRGLREMGQRRGGGYEVGKSKTYAVPIEALYRAFQPPSRQRWLGDVKLTVKKATPHKSMRLTWEDGTPVEAYFAAKGAAKSQVAVQHRNLPSKAAADAVRQAWTERLSALGALLEGQSGSSHPGTRPRKKSSRGTPSITRRSPPR